ncbi:MAG TPA: hypothetical protein VN192_05920 [Flavobacterium sp.]|nr:hypothetical protein [Flavobacterium sp.]
MNFKNFLIAGIVGGIVNFLLGWVFYGMLFKDLYPEDENTNLTLIFLGCITFGLFMSYIFNKWAGITIPLTGLKAGAIIGLFNSLGMNFFMYSSRTLVIENIAIDVIISTIIGAIMGTFVAFTIGKMK